MQVNVDFKKLALWCTPQWLRQSLFVLFLQASLWPLRQTYNKYVFFVKDTLYRLQHNGQVCYLRAVLNDKCDLTLRRIEVVDFDGLIRLYLWRESDLRNLIIDLPVYLYPNDAYADSGIDFTVKVPAALITTSAQLAYVKSLINEYKMAGKNYNIIAI